MNPLMKKFEPFNTTADVGLRVYGKDIIELFENAAIGMFSLVVEPFTPEEIIRKIIELDGDSEEDILFSLLNELVFLFETDGFLLVDIKGERVCKSGFRFEIKGEKYSEDKHELSMHVKAVTYHNLQVKRGETLFADIVFDV